MIIMKRKLIIIVYQLFYIINDLKNVFAFIKMLI